MMSDEAEHSPLRSVIDYWSSSLPSVDPRARRLLVDSRHIRNVTCAIKALGPCCKPRACYAERRQSAASTAGKRPVRTKDRVRTNNDAVCSPEGIRTPDLFLERDEVERSGLANCSRTN
jgi:hypothetical protein